MVDEIEQESSIVGNLVVDTVGVGVLLVEPAEESVGGDLKSPGGHPGAEGEEGSVTEESVGHGGLVRGTGEGVVKEVSELG